MLDPEKGWLASSFLPSFLSSSPSFFFFFFSSSSWYLLVPPDALPVPLSRRLAGPLHPEIKKLMGGRAVGACYVYVVPGFMSAPPRYRSARTPIGTACLVSKSLPPPSSSSSSSLLRRLVHSTFAKRAFPPHHSSSYACSYAGLFIIRSNASSSLIFLSFFLPPVFSPLCTS